MFNPLSDTGGAGRKYISGQLSECTKQLFLQVVITALYHQKTRTMTIREKLIYLASQRGNPCVTISLNTHRIYPDSAPDRIQLKDLMKEAAIRLTEEYGKRPVAPLLDRLKRIEETYDFDYSLDSLHIFLSGEVEEVIKVSWSTYENRVFIGDRFDLRTIIKAYNRSEEYLVLLLSQGGVQLYNALDDGITGEVKNDDFPFDANPHIVVDREERSNARLMDDQVREYFNDVDKALMRVYNETGLHTIVICTEDNYSRLMQVADRPDIYLGHAPINYNKTKPHDIVKQSWEIVKADQEKCRAEAVREMQQAVSERKVVTDIQDIYRASLDGMADLLLVNETFSLPVRMIDERSFEPATDPDRKDVVDDVVSYIALNVVSKGGRVFFTSFDQISGFGDMALKLRY